MLILISIITVIYFTMKVIGFIKFNRFRKSLFILSYETVKSIINNKFMEVGLNGSVLYNKIDDANVLAEIVFNNFDKEENEIYKNPRKFYNKLYKEFKKEKGGFTRFINKRFIGVSNFFRCYGMTELNVNVFAA